MGIVDDRAMNADGKPIMAAKSKLSAVPMMSEEPSAAGPWIRIRSAREARSLILNEEIAPLRHNHLPPP